MIVCYYLGSSHSSNKAEQFQYSILTLQRVKRPTPPSHGTLLVHGYGDALGSIGSATASCLRIPGIHPGLSTLAQRYLAFLA